MFVYWKLIVIVEGVMILIDDQSGIKSGGVVIVIDELIVVSGYVQWR